jgi:endonuclease/exonuclease/phosphatase family metal-dependent hydrolase
LAPSASSREEEALLLPTAAVRERGGRMKVFTWNVLHRIHAEKYQESAIRHFPDEQVRVAQVVGLVGELLQTHGFGVGLLQEVSGDVLAALRAALPTFSVLSHEYPRVPKLEGATSVQRPQELLVVIAPAGATVMQARTFANDRGKGLLQVAVTPALSVVSTHVSFGPSGTSQLEVLRALLHEATAPVVLGGDFNAQAEVVRGAFGPEVQLGLSEAGARPTREGDRGGSTIDHLLVRHASLGSLSVLEHHGLSDHRPVGATVTLPS